MPEQEIDWSQPEEAAKVAAGNWRKFGDFGWHSQPDDADKWCIVYTHNRDSGLAAQSNAAAIDATMSKFVRMGTAREEHHTHWACGWVDGYSIKVYGKKGEITKAFKAWCKIQAALADYPLLDEQDHSQREYDGTIENIMSEGGLDEDEAKKVFSWLWDNNQRAVDPTDDGAAYPSGEAIEEAQDAITAEAFNAEYAKADKTMPLALEG